MIFLITSSSDEAAQNLASLKFSQSNRGPDPREPSRVVTTTTTTTFSMTRDMAKAMCQHFLDARLVENASDASTSLFRDRGVYQLTPKGLHVLERFISKNGINSDHLQPVFTSQPICIKLLHLERRSIDDEIIVTQSVITALFRRFVGRQPNYAPSSDKLLDAFQKYNERSKGITLNDVTERAQPLLGKTQPHHKHCFAAVTALEWLCDFTSVVGREEAAEMAAQFVRFGLITLVSDKRKANEAAIIFTVRGSAPGGNSPVSVSYNYFFSYRHVVDISLFFSNKVNFAAPRKLFTKSRMKAVDLHIGILRGLMALRILPMHLLFILQRVALLAMIRSTVLSTRKSMMQMPKFIAVSHWRRS